MCYSGEEFKQQGYLLYTMDNTSKQSTEGLFTCRVKLNHCNINFCITSGSMKLYADVLTKLNLVNYNQHNIIRVKLCAGVANKTLKSESGTAIIINTKNNSIVLDVLTILFLSSQCLPLKSYILLV